MVEAASAVFDGDAEVKSHFREGHFVKITPSRDYRKAVYGTADNIFPQLILSAGYDGKPYVGGLGFMRDACLNLARLQTVSSTMVKIRHTKSLRPRIGELKESFKRLSEGWGNITTVADRMQASRVGLMTFLDKVYVPPAEDATTGAITRHANIMAKIFARVLAEQQKTGRPISQTQDSTVSVWEAFNAVQGYVQHEARSRQTDPFVRAMLSLSDPTVFKAETIAMSLIA